MQLSKSSRQTFIFHSLNFLSGTPEMLSPVSLEAPSPPPQPSPSAFNVRTPAVSNFGYPQPLHNQQPQQQHHHQQPQYSSHNPINNSNGITSNGRFNFDSHQPMNINIYGQKSSLSPQIDRKGYGGGGSILERSKPMDVSAINPHRMPNADVKIVSSASRPNNSNSSRIKDDDLALSR